MSSEEKPQVRIWRTIVKYFLQGLFYIIPTAVTIYAIFYLVVILDGLIDSDIPGLGILIILVAVTLIGYLGTHFFLAYFRPFDQAIERTPLIKIIYTSMKDLMNAFMGTKKQFKKPVLVEMGSGFEAQRLGFITKSDLSELGIGEEKVAVYLPYSYGINGEVLIVPKKNVTPLNVSSTDVMKFIISGGLTSVEQNDSIKKNDKL